MCLPRIEIKFIDDSFLEKEETWRRKEQKRVGYKERKKTTEEIQGGLPGSECILSNTPAQE